MSALSFNVVGDDGRAMHASDDFVVVVALAHPRVFQTARAFVSHRRHGDVGRINRDLMRCPGEFARFEYFRFYKMFSVAG